MTDRGVQGDFRFAIHLLEQGLAEEDDVLVALDIQRASRERIGALALKCRFLSVRQVFQLLKIQADTPCPFGLLAIEQGFLTPIQVQFLLETQWRHTYPLPEIMLEQGYITSKQLERALSTYEKLRPKPICLYSLVPDASLRSMVESALHFGGIRVQRVHSAEKVLELSTGELSPDSTPSLNRLLIVDDSLPAPRRRPSWRYVRESFPETPIIFLCEAGRDDTTDSDIEALTDHLTAFVTVPFTPERLMSAYTRIA